MSDPKPVAWMLTDPQNPKLRYLEWHQENKPYRGEWIKTPLYAEPPHEAPTCDECGKSKRDGWALYCVKCLWPASGEREDNPSFG